jgi:Domain of unknown function (DUF4440)
MTSHLSCATALVLVLSGLASPRPPESVPDRLRRQAQELIDAITTGSAGVWEKYLDPEARYVDESGDVQTRADMIAGIKPLPDGVSGSIKVQDFDAVVHGDVAVATHVDDENEVFHGHKLHCKYRTTETWKKTKEGWRLIQAQVVALRTDPPAIPISAALREQYCGEYALTPAIHYEIRCKGELLEGQQTGRKPETLRAEAPDVLFVPGKPRYRYVFVRDAAGKITGFAQRREAWDLVWERVGD